MDTFVFLDYRQVGISVQENLMFLLNDGLSEGTSFSYLRISVSSGLFLFLRRKA